MSWHVRALFLALGLTAGCADDDPAADAAIDARADAGDAGDAARDAARDTSPDAILDASVDAEPPDDAAVPDAEIADAAPADAAPVDAADAEVDFDLVYTTIIRARCSCHTLGTSGGLNMNTADIAYANLVDHATSASGECMDNTRVIPMNSAESVLYRKVSAVDLCESRMPLNLPMLPAEEIALIQTWIDLGALR